MPVAKNGMETGRVSLKKVSNMTEAELKECKRLTYPWGGMRQVLGSAGYGTQTALRIFGVDGELKAWALLFTESGPFPGRKHYAYFYVPQRFRRLGLGSRLARSVERWAKRHRRSVTVCPWNKASEAFFSTVKLPREER